MRKQSIFVAAFLVLTLSLAACSASPTPVQPTLASPATTVPSAGNIAAIMIQNYAFNPATLTVKEGTTITWTNGDSVAHTVTSDTGIFDSGDLAEGKTFSYTFTTAGTYPYHCTPHHAKMAGTIVVTK